MTYALLLVGSLQLKGAMHPGNFEPPYNLINGSLRGPVRPVPISPLLYCITSRYVHVSFVVSKTPPFQLWLGPVTDKLPRAEAALVGSTTE